MFREADQILKEYNLKPPLKFKQIHDGTDNNAYLINTGNGKLYVLRESKRLGENKSHAFEAATINLLRQREFPTARIIFSKSGDDHICLHGKAISIFEHIKGQQFSEVTSEILSQGIVKLGGRALGSLHAITKGVVLEVPSKRTIFTEMERLLSIPESSIYRFEGYEQLLIHVKDFQSEAMDLIKAGKAVEGIIHNDFRIQNLIFTDETHCSVIDFDWACPGPLLKDLGLAIAEWSIFDFKTGPSMEAINAFIDGYNETSPIKASYGKELLFWVCFSCLSDTCTFLSDVAEGRHKDKVITKVDQCRMYNKFKYFYGTWKSHS